MLRGHGARPAATPDYDDAWLTHLIAGSRSYLDLGCSAGAFCVIAALDPSRQVVAVDANTWALSWCAANLVATD